MMRNLFASTAVATLIASGAFAQEATATAPQEPAMQTQGAVVAPDGHLATQIIGETVYNGTGDDAQHIGDVNDIVIGANGNIEAVVIGVGGFLGIGEKNVAVDFAQLDWAEKDGDRWLVAPTTKEQLEQQAAFDRSAYEPTRAAAATDPAVTAPAGQEPMDQAAQNTAPANPVAPTAATDTTTTAAIDRSTLKEMPAAEMRAEDLVGTTVYGADDANVGEIGDVLLTADGKIDAYLVDVGGFLGIGEKEVAIGSDNLAFMADKDGNKYLYTTFTKEQLDAAAAYDKGTYAEKRDTQRVITTQ
ncbi:MAG: PRC-barrel domain-containing protein [Hyphomicrobiales bacterium]|nr:PRC-barrel domain-containing protein [Hyphomicrobiales bacterium]